MRKFLIKALTGAAEAVNGWFEPHSWDARKRARRAEIWEPVYQAYEAIGLGPEQYAEAVSRLDETEREALARMIQRAIDRFGSVLSPADVDARNRLMWAKTGLVKKP